MVNMFPFPHSSAETVYLQSRSHLFALSYKVFLDYLALMEKFQDIAKVTQTYLCPIIIIIIIITIIIILPCSIFVGYS